MVAQTVTLLHTTPRLCLPPIGLACLSRLLRVALTRGSVLVLSQIDLSQWPVVKAYIDRLAARPFAQQTVLAPPPEAAASAS
jgi:glutathione S-transferase